MSEPARNHRFHASVSGAEAVADLDAVHFFDRAVQEQPNAFYRALRQRAPIYREESLGVYLVSRYEDLQTVMKDPVTFSMEKGYYSQMAHGYLEELKAVLVKDGGGWFPDVVNVDPPAHQRARSLVQQAFTARRISALQHIFARQVRALVDTAAARGSMEGVKDLALPMAIGFAADQLGVNDLDHATIRRWGAAYLAQFSLFSGREQMMSIAADLCEMQHYLIDLVKRRMEEPGEDMLSDLIGARVEDPRPSLEFEELVAAARAILINTHDSVSTAMVNVLLAVASDDAIAASFYAAADDPERMSRVVEEILRLEPPVRALSRIVTRPVELGGELLPEGAHLLLLFASGNDDEEAFPEAREFLPDRRNLVRNITFGAGRHVCLGIALARMQLRVASCEVARRLKHLRLSVPLEDLRYTPNAALLSIETLPLVFDPAIGQ